MKTASKDSQQKQHPVWTNEVRYISLVGLIILIIYIAYLVRGSLTLVVLAALVAYLLSPIVRFFNRKLRIKRNLAIILAYILLLILIVIGISFIIPRVTQAVRDFLAVDWPQVLSAFDEYIGLLENEVDAVQITVGGFTLDLSEPLQKMQETIRSFRAEAISVESLIPDMTETMRRVFSFSTGIFGQIVTALIMTITAVMASIYFCRDGNRLGGYVVNLFEEKYQPEIRELLHRIRLVWDRYFAGELKLMLYIGLITFLAYSALGIRWALVLGIIAGFCEVVPNIGPILATIPAFVSALIFGSRWIPLNNVAVAVIAVVVAVIIQQTENIFLVPHIMGNALELHPVVVLIGIMALSSRMGLLGAVFAAPLIALSKEVLYFIIKKIKRDDPYPEIYEERA
ncbi:MAG: AI-2E family transporter [Flexilinea sp.]|nr:AI-2E family transporter [Flexilinea sp.]